jgi:hypothetical protein
MERKANNNMSGGRGGRIVDDDSDDDDSNNGEGLGIDDALRRAIAQRMIVPTSPTTNLPSSRETSYDYRIVDDGPRLIPPWKVNESQYNTYEVTENMGYGRHNGEQIPVLMPSETDVAICDDHEYINVDDFIINSYEEKYNDKNETNDNTTAASSSSHASTAKSVTFRTKDEVHSFDRQLEILRNVDEEFFDVARHLMDGDVTTTTETNEEGQTKRNHHHSCGNSVLSLFFGCGTGSDETNDLSPKPYYMSDGGMSSKLYPTAADSTIVKADKLVTDFMSALKYRIENMGDRSDDVATRTKEIAHRIEVYGLPKTYTKTPRIPTSTIRRNEKFAADKSLVMWKSGNTKDDAGNPVKRVPRSFAILPVDNDDDDDDDDENDQGLTNRVYHSKEASSHQTKALSTSSVCTPTSFLPWTKKSVIPPVHSPTSQTRLEQIKSEIQKAQIMFDETLNKKVQFACKQRLTILTNEERLLQIVQERHKIQTMVDTTHDESVKVACRERLTQLMVELQSLQVIARAVKVESKENTPCENDWYDQVLNYVGAVDLVTQQDEPDGRWRRSEENQKSLPTEQCQYDIRSHECANVDYSDHDNQWLRNMGGEISRDDLRGDGRKWTQPRIAFPVVARAVQSRTPLLEWL